MSYAVAAATPIAGDNTGEFKDDLTSRMSFPASSPAIFKLILALIFIPIAIVGEWPKLDNISRITRIVIYAGSIIDSITFTYLLKTPVNGSTTAVVTHGGKGGKLALDYTLTGNFYFVLCRIQNLLTPLELQPVRKSLPFMVAGSLKTLDSANISMCCVLDC
jgi:hypothetical protein